MDTKTNAGVLLNCGQDVDDDGTSTQTSRRSRWIELCDLLSSAVLREARESLTSSRDPEDRLDALKEIVTVAQRLFMLERALAGTIDLAGDEATTFDVEPLAERLKAFLSESHFPMRRAKDASCDATREASSGTCGMAHSDAP